jgi:hypothetical protein
MNPWHVFAFSWIAAPVLMAAAEPLNLPTAQQLQAMFHEIDASGNGAIDAREWRDASVRLFQLTDLNHDDILDETELAANARLRAAYPNLGTFRRGVIAREEFMALRDGMFRGGDIDRNDYVSAVEYEILLLARRTGWNDRNRDERINMSELRDILFGAFIILDVDGDGWLSAAETPFLSPRNRAEMDPEQTGRISRDQLVNGYRWLLGADTTNKNRPKPVLG